MSGAAIAKCWTFASSSGGGRYQTLLYVNGTTSCECPGWCRRVAADGSRSCKHTRSVLMGNADRECLSMHDYGTTAAAPISTVMPARRATTPVTPFGQLGRRKIQTT
jgi:hypothetical protein